MMKSLKAIQTVMLTAVLFTAFSSGAEEKKEIGPLKASFYLIYASHGEKKIDPELSQLVEELAALSFSSYTLISKSEQLSPKGDTLRLALPAEIKGELVIEPLARDVTTDENGRPQVFIKVEASMPGIKTKLKMQNGAIVVIGGLNYKEGSLLVLMRLHSMLPSPNPKTGAKTESATTQDQKETTKKEEKKQKGKK